MRKGGIELFLPIFSKTHRKIYMPELPEVQTIVNDLNRKIKGDVVVGFWSDWQKGIRGSLEKFVAGITGRKILEAERIGKNILLGLSGGKKIIIHLRMTGKLIVEKETNGTKNENHPAKHVHHIFYLKRKRRLEFSDVRKFGSLELVESGKAAESRALGKLGIDVLSKKFLFPEFERLFAGRKTNIKQFLMDQTKIAGLGNIYVNEILYAAGISPLRRTDLLNTEEKKRLYKETVRIIKKAIKLRGTSISDYRDASGEPGRFQNALKVYGRTGKKCQSCGKLIKRVVIGQRSTFYCSDCQK